MRSEGMTFRQPRIVEIVCRIAAHPEPVVSQFEFSCTNSICLSAKSIGVTRPYA